MYHCVKVRDALNGSGVFGDFLVEAVTEVVGGVSGDDEGFPVLLGNNSCKAAAGCGFAHASFTANEDPP
jgi:hypothetical protein